MKQLRLQLAVLAFPFFTFCSATFAQTWGKRPATTTVQKNIVARASAQQGQLSGQSTFQAGSQGCDYRGWCTDVSGVSGGDGLRWRNAINRYYSWLNTQLRLESLDTVKNKMKTIDLSGTTFSPGVPLTDASKTLLVNQIVQVVNAQNSRNPYYLPTNDVATLSYMFVQKQCLEWAMSTAIAAGGQPRAYNALPATDSTKWRAGMGLYMVNGSHAMVIIDVGLNAQGQPIAFKVAEANYANNGWTHAMIPWTRTVQVGRIVTFTGAMKVVSYE